MSNPIENGQIAGILYYAIRDGKAIDDIPGLVKRIISGEMWKELLVKETGEVVNFKSFIDFVTTQPPEGLGTTLDTIKRLGSHDTEMLALVDGATKRKHGNTTSPRDAQGQYIPIFDNIQDWSIPKAPTGTSRQAGLRRIAKSRPDLHTRILSHEISVNAAMVEAGFRPKTLTIPIDPKRAAEVIKRQFSQDQISQLIEFLYKRF